MKAQSDPRKPVQLPVGCLYLFFGAGALFFLAFALVGFGVLYLVTIRPALQARASQAWTATPCEVVTSEVAVTTDSHGDAVEKLHLVYRYAVNERPYESEHYAFRPINAADAHTVVSRLPSGARTICYVDPGDAGQSVIDRELGSQLWIGLFPGAFVAVGLLGAVGLTTALPVMVRRTRAQGEPGLAVPLAQTRPSPLRLPSSGMQPLPMRQPGGAAAIGLWAVAIFWNGITGVVGGGGLWGMFTNADHTTRFVGVPFLLLFLTPFVLIGAALAYAAVRQTLLYVGPRFHLTAPAHVTLGQGFDLQWEVSGRVSRLRALRIDLEGRESAEYRLGTDTRTDTRVFARVPICALDDPHILERGRAMVTVPRDSMHSFTAKHNKIQWLLRVRADVPHWPDVDDDFVLEVSGA
jgi:hypothetical protein